MFCLFVHLYMLTNFGDLRLSTFSCRFIVYISTFAKPMGLYLTFLFAIERIYMKILPKTNYRLLFKRIYFLLICLTMILIFAIKFYQIMKYIPNVPASPRQKLNIPNDNSDDDDDDDDDDNQNNTTGDINFQFCFRTMNVETYAKILSFYLIQYWYEYVIFALIIVILLFFTVYYYFLPYIHSRTLPSTSLNTKFYLILSICYTVFEIILQILHAIVDKEDNRNTDTEVNSLEAMIFIYNLRSIILPSLICLITTNELKQWLYDLFIFRSYLNQINENDQ